MRAQVRLLQLLMDYWDPDSESFNLDGKPLRIEVEDIYFLTGLSRRGEVVNLKAQGAGDHRINLFAPGIEATYVLLSRVLETHGVRLVHLTTG
jgi:hypothetical protein